MNGGGGVASRSRRTVIYVVNQLVLDLSTFEFRLSRIVGWIDGFGAIGPIVYILLLAATIIFTPLPSVVVIGGSSGIGLAISHQLSRALEARLTFQSTFGVGSTFTLWLPKDRRAAAAA